MSDLKRFELVIGDASGEIFNGDVPIRWCVTPEMVKEMEDANVTDPHICIASFIGDRDVEMDRQVVPLTEMMTYLRFKKAGNHRVVAYILSGKIGRKALYNTYIKQKHNNELMEYDYVKDSDSLCYNPKAKIAYGYAVTSTHVEIPAEAFGKEPAGWVKWYSNLWHEGKTVDQCNFRQRMILAFTLKWLPFFIWTFMLVVARLATGAFVFGLGWTRQPQWLQCFRPYKHPGFEYGVFNGETGSIQDNQFYVRKSWESSRYFDKIQWFVTPFAFTPLSFLAQWCLAFLIALNVVHSDYSVAASIYTLMYILPTIVTITLIIDGVFTLMFWVQTTDSLHNTRLRMNALDKKWGEEGKWPNIILGSSVAIIAGFLYLAVFVTWFQYVLAFFALIAFSAGVSMWGVNRMMTAQVEHNDYTQIRELLCPRDPQNMIAEYDAIPKQQRSIRLWAKDMKNKVCKPMQM